MQLAGSYEAILGQARGSYQAGDFEGAIAQYRRLIDRLAGLSDRVLERRPSLRELRINAILELGEILEWEGRIAEAIELERRLLELAPDRERQWKRILAALRIRKGELDAGLEELRWLAEQQPDDVVAWNALATHLRVAGRLEQAEEVLDRAEEAAKTDPERGAVQLNRALLYKALGRVDEALAAWGRAAESSAEMAQFTPEIYGWLIKMGRLQDAQAYVERDPDDARRGLYQGIIAARQGDVSAARAAWSEVHAMDPASMQGSKAAWLEATLRLGDPDPGLRRFEQLLAAEPTTRLFLLAGIGWAMKGDLEAARAGFRAALDAMGRAYPPVYKFDSEDWRLLDQLVADPEIKAQLRPHFAVVDAAFDAVHQVAQPVQERQPKTPGGIFLPGQ